MKEDSILNHPLLKKRRKEANAVVSSFKLNGYSKDSFCIMPFVNIILEPNGSVGFCRHKGTEHSFGNIQNQSINEILNCKEVQNWRKEFIQGKPSICASDIKNNKCNLCPQLNQLYQEEYIKEIVPLQPLRLTANFNGQCNLECEMCHIWKMPNGLYTDENFWIPAKENLFSQLQEIDMLSGEPFIQKDTYRLINEVSVQNKDCLWTITTNAHYKLTNHIKKHLDKIKIKNIIISIDSLDPITYAEIRKKGKLSTVKKCLEDFLLYEKTRKERGLTPLSINVNFLILKNNWKDIKKNIDYCLERSIHPFVTFCYEPSKCSILSLPEEERTFILHYYLDNLSWEYITLATRVITPILNSLSKTNKAFFLLKISDIKKNFEE